MSRGADHDNSDDEPPLSHADGLAVLARLIADDMRRRGGGGRGGAPVQPAPSQPAPGRRGRYRPRHPLTIVLVPAARRPRAS